MRPSVTAAALALVIGLAPAGLADDKGIEQALRHDQGTWRFVSLVTDGKKTDGETLKDWRLVITGKDWIVRKGDEVLLKGTYKVEAVDGKVRRTAVTVSEGVAEKQTSLGISTVAGNTRKACLAKQGKPRPKTFSSKEGSGHVFVTWERVRP